MSLNSFYMGKYEVTQGEYKALMGKNPSDTDRGIGDNYPVNQVNWYDAVEYCNALSRREGLNPCYVIDKTRQDPSNNTVYVYDKLRWIVTCSFDANGYRLPTEAEWEFAARGGTGSRGYIYAGSSSIDSVAWNKDNSGSKSHPVGGKQANELGLYDMTGNVWEWCWDWYGNYSGGSQSNPSGPSSGSNRVVRGGGWNYNASHSRAANRSNNFLQPYGYTNGGFRVVRRP